MDLTFLFGVYLGMEGAETRVSLQSQAIFKPIILCFGLHGAGIKGLHDHPKPERLPGEN